MGVDGKHSDLGSAEGILREWNRLTHTCQSHGCCQFISKDLKNLFDTIRALKSVHIKFIKIIIVINMIQINSLIHTKGLEVKVKINEQKKMIACKAWVFSFLKA